MPSIEDQIKEIEDEIKKTQYNKATQHHIGKLKAKLARLKDESEKRRSSGGGAGRSYSVKKSGVATVCLVGFPSVGKSTLLNKITNAQSKIGAYDFTTLDIVPGAMDYKGTKIQILDMPGLIKGASRGKGRGREVISVARTVDLVILLGDVSKPDVNVLVDELEGVGIRLNKKRPDVVCTKKTRGGIVVNPTVKLTKIDEKLIKSVLNEYGIINADIVIRENISLEQLIDSISANRVYITAFAVINKIDLVDKNTLKEISKKLSGLDVIYISAEKNTRIDEVREKIFASLNFIRLYMRPQGGETDYKEPMIIKKGSTVRTVCEILHKDFIKKFKNAQIWGKSARFPGQTVGLEHKLMDEDVLTIVLQR